jgi:hypothetical protein
MVIFLAFLEVSRTFIKKSRKYNDEQEQKILYAFLVRCNPPTESPCFSFHFGNVI